MEKRNTAVESESQAAISSGNLPTYFPNALFEILSQFDMLPPSKMQKTQRPKGV